MMSTSLYSLTHKGTSLCRALIPFTRNLTDNCGIINLINEKKKLTVEENKYKTTIPSSYFGSFSPLPSPEYTKKWPQVVENLVMPRFTSKNTNISKKFVSSAKGKHKSKIKHCHEIQIDMKNFFPYEIKIQIKSGNKIQVLGKHGKERLKAIYMIPYEYNIDELKAFYNRGQVIIQTPRIRNPFQSNIKPFPKFETFPEDMLPATVIEVESNMHCGNRRNK